MTNMNPMNTAPQNGGLICAVTQDGERWQVRYARKAWRMDTLPRWLMGFAPRPPMELVGWRPLGSDELLTYGITEPADQREQAHVETASRCASLERQLAAMTIRAEKAERQLG